ncbi:MAG TPA: tape measure protein [Clostridia bacterium]|nr:tape measure protein [Clostridia bacterium]
MKLFELYAGLGLDDSEFNKKVDQATSTGKRMETGIKASTLAAGQLLANFAQKAITGVINLAKTGLEYNQQMEDYTTNFTVMLGDAAKAAEKVQQLKEFAASTPFAMEDLAASTQTLLAFGVESEKTQGIMKQLGDISLGNAEKFGRLSTAYGKANSMGKLTGETVQQMIEAGFNPLLLISEKTGESMVDLQKRMSAGKVSVEELNGALETATSTGGQFNDGMKQASLTTSGLISTLKDNFTAMLGKLSQGFSNVLKDSVLPKLIGMVEKLTGYIDDSADKFEEFGDKLGDFVEDALDGLMEAIEWLIDNGGDLFDAFTSIGTIIGKLASAIVPAILNVLPKVATAFGGIMDKVMPLVETLVNGFAAAITWIADNAETLIPILEGVAAATLLWNGYQAILNITMAANPIGAVIKAVALLAGGLMLLNDAFGASNDGMNRFNSVADDIANNTTDFSDLVSRMTPNILDVNDLISSTGKTVGELQSTIQEKEDAITAILKSAMEDHRGLRQDELDDIAKYNADIASLNDELIEQYRSVELAKLRQIQLEAGDMTVEQMAQYEADMKSALESANQTSEDAYVARLATIENTHKAIGDIGSAAYLKEQQDAKANYEAQLAENQSYYDQANAIFLESAAVLVGAEKKKNSDLQIEYQTGLDNLNAHYDQWTKYTTDHYSNMNNMDSEQAQEEKAASDQWYADKQASLLAAQDAEIQAIEAKNAQINTMQANQDGEVHLYTQQMYQQELESAYAYYADELAAAKEAHDAQYQEIVNKYGSVNELESAEAQADLARIEQERKDQTAAWIALYDDKNAAAEAGNAEQMQLTQAAFDELKAAQEQFNADIEALDNGALTSNNQTSANWIVGMLIANRQKAEANDDYAAAYATFLDGLDSDAWNSFLYQYDVAKQAGTDIPAEYTAMLSALLDTFESMPEDMQDEGKEMLNGLLSGVTDESIRASLENEATDAADSVVGAIKDAWDINSPSKVADGLAGNFMGALSDGFSGRKSSLLSTVSSIASELVNSFLSLFGITRTTSSSGKVTYSTNSHATGKDYVPYDNYPAMLHEGEAVLTKAEATDWRRGDSGSAIDLSGFSSSIAEAVKSALNGAGFYVDGKQTGYLVAAGVNEAITGNVDSLLRSGYNGTP